MKILFLDDNPERHEYFKTITIGQDVTHVWNSQECMDALANNDPFDLVCLDHDLAGAYFQEDKANSGTEVAEWIHYKLAKDKYPKKVIIHSWNSTGAERMYKWIEPTGIPVVRKRFEV